MMMLAVLLSVIVTVLGQDCASLPASAEFWSLLAPNAQVHNNAENALVLAFDATDSLEASFGTAFAEPQDLTQHSVLSFNLHKVHQPVRVYVSVSTPQGEHRSAAADLFENQNTITVDLASHEFATADSDEYNRPIVGLARVSAVRVHLVASALGHSEAVLDSMVVCAADDESVSSAIALEAPAADEVPDLNELHTLLDAALQEVKTLRAEIEELKSQQRKGARTFQEFGVRTHATLDNAVEALGSAMQANVEQTLQQSKVFKAFREHISTRVQQHDTAIEQLKATHAALHDLGRVRPNERLSDAVARVNAEEAAAADAADAQVLEKRSLAKAAAVEALSKPAAHAPEIRDAFHIPQNKRRAPAVVVPAP